MRGNIKSLAVHVAGLWCAWASDVHGVAGAGNLLAAWLCVYAIVGIVLALSTPRNGDSLIRPQPFRFLIVLMTWSLSVHLVWYGHPVLLVLLLIGVTGFAMCRFKAQASAAKG